MPDFFTRPFLCTLKLLKRLTVLLSSGWKPLVQHAQEFGRVPHIVHKKGTGLFFVSDSIIWKYVVYTKSKPKLNISLYLLPIMEWKKHVRKKLKIGAFFILSKKSLFLGWARCCRQTERKVAWTMKINFRGFIGRSTELFLTINCGTFHLPSDYEFVDMCYSIRDRLKKNG